MSLKIDGNKILKQDTDKLIIENSSISSKNVYVTNSCTVINSCATNKDLVVGKNITLKGSMYDKDGWKYELISNKPSYTKEYDDAFELKGIDYYKSVYFVFDRELKANLEVTLNFELRYIQYVSDFKEQLTNNTPLNEISFNRDFSTINSSDNVLCRKQSFDFNGKVYNYENKNYYDTSIGELNICCQYCQYQGKPALKLYIDPNPKKIYRYADMHFTIEGNSVNFKLL